MSEVYPTPELKPSPKDSRTRERAIHGPRPKNRSGAPEESGSWFDVKALRRRLDRGIRQTIWSEERKARGILSRLGWGSVQIVDLAVRGYREHECSLRASSLTFTAFLSFVPLLALVFSILKGLGQQEVLARILASFTVGSEETAQETLRTLVEFIDNTQVVSLSSFGAVALFLVSLSVMRTIERAINKIWGISRARRLSRMLPDYLSLIVIAPVVLAMGIYVTTIFKVPGEVPLAGLINHVLVAPFLLILPYLAICGMFSFIYYFMPNTRVNWSSAVLGGVIGGILWNIAQAIYIVLTVWFYEKQYNAIYGALAWLFILLIWVRASWTILLFGAEISHAHQNLEEHRRRKRPWTGSPAEKESLALRVAALITRPMLAKLGERPEIMTLSHMADLLRLPAAPVQEILDEYQAAGIVTKVEDPKSYLLTREPENLTVLDLLRLVRHGPGGESAERRSGGPIAQTGRTVAEVLGGMTLKDLAKMPLDEIRTIDLGAAQGAS